MRLRLSLLSAVILMLAAPAWSQKASAQEPDQAAVDDVVSAYRLADADKVRVSVFGEPALTGEFSVGENGGVSLPLIGVVPARGLTLMEFEAAVTSALRDGFLNDPRVRVEMLSYRPIYILGEVNTPGEYPYTPGLSVLNVVAMAGGFTYRANQRSILIKRATADAEQAYRLTPTSHVAPGDIVRIRERYF